MNKKKKFFACSACLLGFIICSCEVMADAPDDVIISVLNNYPDYFKQNNIIFDVIRWISWLLITLLRVIANFCVTLYEYSLGLLTLISENINKFVPYAHELFTAILAISLLAMGVMLIVHPKKKPDLLLSLFLMVMALSLQTVILNPMIAPTQAAIRELSMTNSIVDRIVNSHIHDLLYIDQKLPNGLIDLASGNIDIASLIDAMSIMSILKEKGLDYKNHSFLSLSGVDKNNALKFHLDHNKKFQSVLLALDNDSAGKKISKLIIKEFADRKDLCITEHYPSSKDWNQEITNFFRFGKPLSDIDFFKNSVTLHIKARKNIIER